jgi:hypothetical protein
MSDAIVGLVGALVGGLAALGGAIVQARASERSDLRRTEAAARQTRDDTERREAESYRELGQRYLFQLRDAVESLDARAKNWTERGGAGFAESRDPGYWRMTTLYAIGRALAAERILDLEGVYVQIETAFGQRLARRQVEKAIERAMESELFYYHRLALAESILERGANGFRLLTYSEFRRRFADPEWELDVLLEPVTKAIAHLENTKLIRLRADLTSLAQQLDHMMRGDGAGRAHSSTLTAPGKVGQAEL